MVHRDKTAAFLKVRVAQETCAESLVSSLRVGLRRIGGMALLADGQDREFQRNLMDKYRSFSKLGSAPTPQKCELY